MELRKRIQQGSLGIKFKMKEKEPMPLPGSPGAPPPPKGPIFNDFPHEIDNNKTGDLPEENTKKTGFTHKNDKTLDIKKVRRLKTARPR